MSRPSGGVSRGPGGPGVVLPRSVPLPSLGGQHCGRHRRRSGHGGAAPILLRFVVVRRPRAWPLRWSCALVRARPPAATLAGAGSAGCGGARRAGPAASPFRASRSFLREGRRPLGCGGVEGRRPRGPQAGQESGGEGGGAPLPPSPPPWGAALGPRPCPPPSPAHPPWVYTGRRAVVGARRGPVGRRWVSAGGGRRGFLATACSPAFPRRASKRAASPAYLRAPPCCCGPRRWRRAAGRQRVMRKSAGGRPGALDARLRSLRLRRLAPGCSGPSGGLRGRRHSGQPPAAHGRGGGGGEGVRGGAGVGSPLSPPRLLGAAPRWPRWGGLVVPVHGGQPLTGGGVPFPRLPSAHGCWALGQVLAQVP